jgi:hypothetical protein
MVEEHSNITAKTHKAAAPRNDSCWPLYRYENKTDGQKIREIKVVKYL